MAGSGLDVMEGVRKSGKLKLDLAIQRYGLLEN